MGTARRRLYLNASGGAITKGGGAETILTVLREYLQHDKSGHIYQQATQFLQKERTDRTMVRYLLELDVPRRRAEARALMGTAAS